MSLKKYSHEEISKMSMIEIANVILEDSKKAIDFREIFQQIAEIKGFTDEEKEKYITQFYTDLNIDGRFMTTGSNLWGLKRWYPVEQRDEEITNTPRKKKKTKKKATKKDDYDDEDEDNDEELDIVDDDIDELVDDLDNDEDDEDYDVDDDDNDDYSDDDDFDDEDYDEDDDDDESLDDEEEDQK